MGGSLNDCGGGRVGVVGVVLKVGLVKGVGAFGEWGLLVMGEPGICWGDVIKGGGDIVNG